MREGKNRQIRRPVRGVYLALITGLVLLGGVSCKARRKQVKKQPSAHKTEVVKAKTQKKQANKPKLEAKKPSGPQADFASYVKMLNTCDRYYFSHINPDSIDNWETPVPLGPMQSRCDELVSKADDLGKKYILHGRKTDELLYNIYKMADLYRMFLSQCKRMSVRNKLPWKKKVANFQKNLRETAKRIRDLNAGIKWEQVKPVEPDKAYLAWLAKNYLGKALKQGVTYGFKQAYGKKPVYLYALKFNALILKGIVDKAQLDEKARKHFKVFADAYQDMVSFFSGNYFEQVKTRGKALERTLKKTGSRFKHLIRNWK